MLYGFSLDSGQGKPYAVLLFYPQGEDFRQRLIGSVGNTVHQTIPIMSDTLVDDRFISGLTDLKAVGRYKIVRKLGQGGTAVVYLGSAAGQGAMRRTHEGIYQMDRQPRPDEAVLPGR